MCYREVLLFSILQLFNFEIHPCLAQDTFYFSKQPESASVISGHSTTLQCSVEPSNGVWLEWKHDGVSITNTSRRYQKEGNLEIVRADKSDTGSYNCIAAQETTGVALTSRTAIVDVVWLGKTATVELQTPSKLEEIQEGKDVVLHCRVEGNGNVKIGWFRNSDTVRQSEKITIRHRRLHILPLQKNDSGLYFCRASNGAGSVDSRPSIKIIVPLNDVEVIQVPEDRLVSAGNTVDFHCVINGVERISWWKNGEELSNTSSIHIFTNHTLQLQNVTSTDSGFYKCAAQQNAEKMEFAARLHIAYLDEMSSLSIEPTEQILVTGEGSDVQITCNGPKSDPIPDIWWEDSKGSKIGKDKILILEEMSEKKAGQFTCVAQNDAGVRNFTVEVIVVKPPTLLNGPVTTWAEEDGTVSLTCEYHGSAYPLTKIKWFKDEYLMNDNEDASDNQDPHYIINHQTGSLKFEHLSVVDGGNYSCQVVTKGFPEVASQVAVLHVKERLKFVPSPVSRKLELGSEAKIHCRAKGAAQPVVRWMKVGQPLFEWPSHIKDVNGTLIFNVVQSKDKGRYTCVATSSSAVINITISVDVIVAPKFRTRPDNFTLAMEGTTVLLSCDVEGDPPPAIQWDRDGVLNGFDPSRFLVLPNGTLEVRSAQVEDSGKYGCTAGNSGGFKREEVRLEITLGREDVMEDAMLSKTVMITLSAAAGYMFLVVGLMLWCRWRQLKRKREYAEAEGGKSDGAETAELQEQQPANGTDHEAGNHVTPDSPATSNHTSSKSSPNKSKHHRRDRMNISRREVEVVSLLGRGEMGEVLLARRRGNMVLAKSMQTRDEGTQVEFRRQIDLFGKIKTERVTKLIGVCGNNGRKSESSKRREENNDLPPLLVLEYLDWGDLKQFLSVTNTVNTNNLTNNCNENETKPVTLSYKQEIELIKQAAEGMEHLASQRLVHRDLAARNCVISSSLQLKISLIGLSKDVYAKEYYHFRNQVIPLRWMPHEAVFEEDHSTKSDIWSFACLSWEILSRCKDLPLSSLEDQEFLEALRTNQLKWEVPSHTPKQLKSLMLRCWAHCPRERPDFAEILLQASDICNNSEQDS